MGTLVLPKIHSVRDLHHVSRTIRDLNPSFTPLHIVASIESARSVVGLGDIASWRSDFGPEKGGELMALLVSLLHHLHPRSSYGQHQFAAEDCMALFSTEIRCMTVRIDCADTSVLRTTSRQELLFVRSQIVITAKAFGLEAIDMVCPGPTLHSGVLQVFQVCVNYKDPEYLREECEDGRRLGFTGKV